MDLTEVQIAGLTRALGTLDAEPDYQHPLSLIRRIGGPEVVAEIKDVAAEYKAANLVSLTSGVTLLSASAADYWHEARGVLSYGRLVLSMGSRKAEKVLGRKCEALDESFEARVAPNERGMFLIHELEGGNWDDRWHACIDFNFPLLRRDLGGATAYKNPMSEAQRTVLGALVHPVVKREVREASVLRLRDMLLSITREKSLTLAKLQKQKAAEQASAARKAKVAAGDQKATKDLRGKMLKPVTDLFDEPDRK